MDCSGVVTSINNDTWTFEIDNGFFVHMPHLAVFKNAQLPTLGDYIEIKRAHYIKTGSNVHLFISSRRNLKKFTETSKKNDTPLLRLIRSCKIGYTDLLEVSLNVNSLKVFSQTIPNVSADVLTIATAKIIAKTNRGALLNKKDPCMNKVIPRFSLSSISKQKYVDNNSIIDVNAPYWSYGTHFKTKSSEYLVGFLFVNHTYGTIVLKDDDHNIVCIILRATSNKVISLINRFVLLRDYFIFTEIYNDVHTNNIEYLIVDYENIEIVDCNLGICKELNFVNSSTVCDYSECFKFILLNKGTVSLNERSLSVECSLEVALVDQEYREIFLCLNVHYLNVIPFLKCGNVYCVYHNKKLLKTNNFNKCKSGVVTYTFSEENAVFALFSSGSPEDKLMNFEEAVKHVKKQYKLISFQALVKKKYFMEPLKNKKLSKKHYSFGTPGEKVHVIEFYEKDCKGFLSLYMHNWENLQMPLGLVPHMRVALHQVTSYNGYFKPNVLSRIEILSYEPPVKFQTCNLCDDDDWGEPSFFGYGDLIPVGVLVWGRILTFSLRFLKISYQCVNCKSSRKGHYQACTKCNKNEKYLSVNITAIISDEMGQSKIICNNAHLLQLILKMQPQEWRIWCKAFEYVGEYCFGIKNWDDENSKINTFCETLTASLKTVNATYISNLELKCRKIETSNDDMPLWYCLDARETLRF